MLNLMSIFKLSSNMFDTNESAYSHNLLLTKIIVGNLCEGFENQAPADAKLSRTQILKITRFGGFFGALTQRLSETFIETALTLV